MIFFSLALFCFIQVSSLGKERWAVFAKKNRDTMISNDLLASDLEKLSELVEIESKQKRLEKSTRKS